MNAIVSFALRQRVLIVVLLVMMLGAGVASFLKLNIEAYPDPVPPLVDVVTQSTGQSAEEIERYITIPLEIQMAGIPNVQAIRTISLFGLSDVKVQFTYDFTYYQAEQWVTNRLSQLGALPNGAQPQISPTSPIGEIFRYRVVGPPNYSVTDLKTLEDWVLERRFKAVPGVIDVTGWGGKTKTYDIAIDQHKLMAYGLSVPQVLSALGNANINVGGQTVNFGAQAAVVRGVGLIHSTDEIRHTLIADNQGAPVFIGDVAQVTIGHLPRLGIAGYNDIDDIVQGIVLMRRGAQSVPTIKRVEAEVDKINKSGILPPGVSIERIYDRSDLIRITTRTVLHNMLAGIVLIFILQWAFLGNLRSACIVAMTIPFALSFAIGLMVLRGESANLLSVGAIDFGLVVDATVIMVENIYQTPGGGIRASGYRTEPLAPDASPQRLSRQDGNDFARRGRGQPVDFFRRGDHHRRVRAALHAVRNRGAHFRADGEDLRVCHRRRLDCNLHHRAGARLAVLSAGRVGARNARWCGGCAVFTTGAGIRAREPHHHLHGFGAARDRGGVRGALAGPRVSAQARGGESVGPCDVPAVGVARGQRHVRQSHARD